MTDALKQWKDMDLLRNHAVDLLSACSAAYGRFLELNPTSEERLRSQIVMARLRDTIASAQGLSAEDIQNAFESEYQNASDF